MTNAGWAVPATIQPDELLSSWLVRSALANGCDPLAFADAIWPKWRMWCIDVDRRLPATQIKVLSASSGLPADAIAGSTLESVAARVSMGELPIKNFWYWILSLGCRNRRRNGGVQYCPDCLAEDKFPYFRIHWRYAWHTVCQRHDVMLLDRCHGCASAIQPHRLTVESASMGACPICGCDLKYGATHRFLNGEYLFQVAADDGLTHGRQLVHGVAVPIADWFAIARFYWAFVRRMLEGRTESLVAFAQESGISDLKIRPVSSSIENAMAPDRHWMFVGILKIMTLSTQEMKSTLEASGVTMQAFCPNRMGLPIALYDISSGLVNRSVSRTRKPKNVNNPSKEPKSLRAVERMMHRLGRKAGILGL